jgi:3-oxoacyl-[acyl-carrier-protein] synthase-3
LPFAAVGPVAVHFPHAAETNEQLTAEHPRWDMGLIYEKTGIAKRHIAGVNECASDLGVAAAEKLFNEQGVDRSSIDFLLFCTQTPDYPLPTTACLMQHRLGLRTNIGALDFNLGCSGFVYGLSLAEGLIRAGSARRVLLITAETYSKYIDREDRSLRTIFGDGAAATVVDAVQTPSLGGFSFGTDGSGADMLMLTRSGTRPSGNCLKPRTRHRWPSDLYMDGPGLVYFTVETMPKAVDDVLTKAGVDGDSIDLFLMHQPTRMMLERLRDCLGVEPERMPMVLEDCGNTVSSTIPIVIDTLRRDGRLKPGVRTLMVGFGVGLSWAACAWTETWDGANHVESRLFANQQRALT